MKPIKPSNADVNRSRRKSTRKVTIAQAPLTVAPVTYTSTLSFPSQQPSIPPPLQIYTPTPAVFPPPVIAPPRNSPSNLAEPVVPQSPAPLNPSMAVPLQPINYPPLPPPSTQQPPQMALTRPDYASLPVQHSPMHPVPSPIEPVAGPSAPNTQYNGHLGGVSFAPISTPAIEACT
jgi:hypothetical protein